MSQYIVTDGSMLAIGPFLTWVEAKVFAAKREKALRLNYNLRIIMILKPQATAEGLR